MPSATIVSIQAAKEQLDGLLDRASYGEEIVIAMGDKPIAKLSAIPLKRKPLPYGLLKGKLIPRANFDEPLADDEKEFFMPRAD